jgi:hypothetical protein
LAVDTRHFFDPTNPPIRVLFDDGGVGVVHGGIVAKLGKSKSSREGFFNPILEERFAYIG